jgi:hypothetical protein
VPSQQKTYHILCVFSGFCCEVNENCALLSYYAASSGNFLPPFQTTYRSHLDPCRWDRQVFPKRLKEITTTRCVITQRSAVHTSHSKYPVPLIFITTSLKSVVLSTICAVVTHFSLDNCGTVLSFSVIVYFRLEMNKPIVKISVRNFGHLQ